MAADSKARGASEWIGARFDSLINVLSGLGGSNDRTMNTRVSGMIELSEIELEVLYRTNHYAAKVVDLLPDDSTRRGFTITTNEGNGDEFDEELKRLGAVAAINQADKWARLYGGGAVIIGLNDGKDTSEPIDLDALDRGQGIGKSIDFLHPIDMYSLDYREIEADPRMPGFGKPKYYALNFRDLAAFSTASGIDNGLEFGQVIHASRLVRLYGVPLPPNLASDQDWWGDSVLQRAYESISNLSMFERAIGNIGQTFTQAIFKMKGLRNLVKSKDGEKILMDRFTAMNLSQSVLSMMIIDADGEEYEKRTTQVSGLDSLYDRIAQSYAAAANMPMTLAFGQAPGGLSTDDAAGARNWDNAVRSSQDKRYVPSLEYIAKIIAATDEGPSSSQITIAPNSLNEPSEKEQSTTAKTWSEFAAILIDRGVITPDEVRQSFFSSVGFSSEITLNEPAGDAFDEPDTSIEP